MFVGLDVHKATFSAAVAQEARGGEEHCWGTIPNRANYVRVLAEQLGIDGRRLHFLGATGGIGPDTGLENGCAKVCHGSGAIVSLFATS